MDLLKAIGAALALWLFWWLAEGYMTLSSSDSLKREIVQLAYQLRGERLDDAAADAIAAEHFKLKPPWKL